jgi:hypothetical protein
MKTPQRDREARTRLAAQPLFARVFAPGSVPTWSELADAAERLRLEGEGSLSAETMLAAAMLEQPNLFAAVERPEEPPAHGRRST